MASYEKQSGKWSVRFRHEGQNKRLSGYDTKKEAEQAHRLFMLKADDDAKAKDITIRELYDLYKAYKVTRVKESSFLTIRNSLDKYLVTLLDYKITDVTPQVIIKWQDMINENDFSYNFKSKLHTMLYNLFNFAVEYYGLPVNPMQKVKNFKNLEPKKQMTIWTEQEFEQFIGVVDRYDYRVFFALLYLTGCRKGEALALTWADVDFDEPSLRIDKTYTRATESALYKITSAKTRGSNRTVIIPDVLLRLLKGLYSHQSARWTSLPRQFHFRRNKAVFHNGVRQKESAILQGGRHQANSLPRFSTQPRKLADQQGTKYFVDRRAAGTQRHQYDPQHIQPSLPKQAKGTHGLIRPKN